MKKLNEDLLSAWLKLRLTISNERIVSDMPYNESLICNILLRNYIRSPKQYLTATDLCKETRMLKSQMNRTLKSLEEKGMIVRERSTEDRRRIYIKFSPDSPDIFTEQHRKNLELVDAIVKKVGVEKSREILENFKLIAEAAEEIINC
ncbi:MarR family transcriptional regulator [Roseburia hominis]